MASINLLPWRADRRRQRERDFYAMLGAAAVAAVLAWLLWGYWMGLRTDDQDARNTYLSGEISKLDVKLVEIKELENTENKLLARKKIIEQLQASRSQMVHLFDELVKTIPDGVRLTSLKQNADLLTLAGVAQANGNVAAYMRNLDQSQWMSKSDLQRTEIKGTDQRNRYEFGMTVKTRTGDQPDAPLPVKPGAPVAAPSAAPTVPAPTAPAAGAKP